VSEPVRLRDCRPEDIDEVLLLWARSDTISTANDSADALRTRLRRDLDLFLLAVDDRTIIGCVMGGWDGWRGNIYRLVVDSPYRRRGIATMLVTEAERRLRALGASRIYALAAEDEPAAIAFWRRLGYQPNPIVRPYVKDLH